jgi:hypothetical protein
MDPKKRLLVSIVAVLVLLWSPSACFAALSGRIYENRGVKTARLALHDTTNDHRIGGSYKRITDKSYAGQTVYRYDFGTRSKVTHHYPIQMYSKSNHHVFTFILYSSAFVTANGTHVGTTEEALVSRYGDLLTKSTGPVYTDYSMGTRSGRTDFYVLGGKVHHIVISTY